MNERLDVLAKQAAEYAIEFAVKDQELYIPKLMEKFAELLVRECIVVVEDSEGYSQYFPHVARNIEKHFEVK